ncbi:MAG: hypothetical protein WC862_02860 [Patescibacteria group bacterium]
MTWEEAEGRARADHRDRKQEINRIIGEGATEIAASIQGVLDRIMADEENRAVFWDDTPGGKKSYLATLLHVAAIKLGLNPDEVKEADVRNLE